MHKETTNHLATFDGAVDLNASDETPVDPKPDTKPDIEEASASEKDQKLPESESTETGQETGQEDKDEGTDSIPPDDTTASEDGSGEEITKEKPKRSVQERINAAVKKQRDAERRSQELEDELSQLKTAAETKPPEKDLTKEATSDTDEVKAPSPDDFEYGELDQRYIAALARHEAKSMFDEYVAEREEKTEQTRQQEAAQHAAEEFLTKYDSMTEVGISKYEDFETVVTEAAKENKFPLSPELAHLIVESDVGADVAYHLATHVDEAAQVFDKSPLQQAAYFGKLETQFSSNSDADTNTEAKPTQAPPPAKKARGSGGSSSPDPTTADFDTFLSMWNKRQR